MTTKKTNGVIHRPKVVFTVFGNFYTFAQNQNKSGMRSPEAPVESSAIAGTMKQEIGFQ